MKRSTWTIVLVLTIVAVAVLDVAVGGSLAVLSTLPLCGIAILYGVPGAAMASAYLLLLWIATEGTAGIGYPPVWQWVVVFGAPLLTAFVSSAWQRGIDVQRMHWRLLDGMRDGVILSDERFAIHLINPAASALLALPSSAAERLARLEALGVVGLWADCVRDQPAAVTCECHVDERLLQVTVTPVIEHGEVTCLVTTIIDFTAERQLAAMREDFQALITHEIRSPLTSIAGFIEILARRPLSEGDAECVRIIKRNADRMQRLTRELLQLRSLETGALQLQRERTELAALLRQVVTDLERQAADADVSLRLSTPPDPAWGSFDPDRLTQVFDNLLSNALKFSLRKGEVRITVSVDENAALIEVNDQGPGIPPEDIEGIFRKYYRTSAGRGASGGVGLGLPISRNIVELHGGKTWASCDEHLGTSFWVSLPLSPAEAGPVETCGTEVNSSADA